MVFSLNFNKIDKIFIFPRRLKQSVGNTGDLRVETNAILLENDLDVNPFEDVLLEDLPLSGYIPTEQDLEGREDWRNHCIFTIDPETAKDLDDAVSCQLLANGNYEVTFYFPILLLCKKFVYIANNFPFLHYCNVRGYF